MLGSPAIAEILTVRGPTGKTFDADALYLVTYKCRPEGDTTLSMPGPGDFIMPDGIEDMFDPFGGGGRSVTHGFFITKGSPKQALGVGDFASSAKGVGAELVFISDGISDNTGGTQDVDNRHCAGSYIVRGSDDPNLTGFMIQAKAAQTKQLAATMTFISAAAGPLTNLVTSAALQAPVSGQMQSLGQLSSTFETFMRAFDSSKATQSTLKLVPGTFLVQTSETTVTIKVSKLDDGLLRSSGSLFKVGINALAENLQLETISSTELKAEDDEGVTKCRGISNVWSSRGITDQVDLAYVLWRSVAATGPTKQQFVRCLGRDLAVAAVPYLDKFDLPTSDLRYKKGEIDGLLANSKTANADFGPQPTDSGLEDRATVIAQGMSRLTGPAGLAEDDLAEFASYFVDKVKLKDSSEGYVLARFIIPEFPKKTSVSGDIQVIAAHLKAQKIRVANCALLGASGFQSVKNEAVILLATRAATTAGEPTLLEIRVIHDASGKIVELRITSDLTLDEVKDQCPALDKIKIVTASAG